MSDTIIWLEVVIVTLFGTVVYCLYFIQRMYHKLELAKLVPKVDNSQLTLTAYERLTLLCERTKLESLIQTHNQSNSTANTMHNILVSAIKEEYNYNLSQQLYVKPEIWQAVTKMKEQLIYLLNQVKNVMPVTATSTDFNKSLLEMVQANPNITMNNIVLDALQHEVKNVL